MKKLVELESKLDRLGMRHKGEITKISIGRKGP